MKGVQCSRSGNRVVLVHRQNMAFQDHHELSQQQIPLQLPRYSDHHHPFPSPEDKPSTWLHHQWLPTQSQPSPPDNSDHRQDSGDSNDAAWEKERCKADILSHPLYDQLLSAHVACLRIATPVDQLPKIDAQLAQSHQMLAKYSVLGHAHQPLHDKDLDHFMLRQPKK